MDKNEVFVSDDFKDKEQINVQLFEPNMGWVHYITHDNRMDLVAGMVRMETRSKYKFHVGTIGRLMIQYAREIVCDNAMETGMDYILWIDDDMMVDFDVFERLVKLDADIAAPLAFSRRPPYEPVIYKLNREEKENGDIMLNSQSYIDYPKNEIIEVDAVGFGVVLMKVSLLRKMEKPFFFVNQPVGEDILFCMRAKEQVPDVKIRIDTSFDVGHMGDPPIITEKDFMKERETERYKQWKKEKPEGDED